MKNKKVIGILLFNLILLLGFLPFTPSNAAIISIKSSNSEIGVGDVVMVDVFINTEGKSINVVEGDVGFITGFENIKVKDFSFAGSDFVYWPNKPSLIEGAKKISFVAGTPGGINKKTALLFRVALEGIKDGPLVISPGNLKVYINDGRATPANVSIEPSTLSVVPQQKPSIANQLQKIIIGDRNKPFSFKAEIGSDPSLFDGKTFVVFSALDRESGIDHYEVREGDREPVRSGNIYVFQNQEKLEPTIIFAYDKAGNSRKIVLREKGALEKIYLWQVALTVCVVLLLVVALLIFWKLFQKRKKKNVKNK